MPYLARASKRRPAWLVGRSLGKVHERMLRSASINGSSTVPAVAPVNNGLPTVRPAGSRQAAFVLQIYITAAFLLPSDTVIRVIGAQGYLASLCALTMFLAWGFTAILGYHDPVHTRYPVRGALGLMWISSLLSYAVMPLYGPTETQRLSADRWILLWIGMSGVILMAAEHLRAKADIVRVVRTLVWGVTASGVIAILQYWFRWDLRPYLRMGLVGFEYDDSYSTFNIRDGLIRVTGTANHPIEMGVIAGMLLPLAVWVGVYYRTGSTVRRWLPVAIVGMCIPMSVSRSAILAVVTSLAVFTVLQTAAHRAWIMAFLPVGIVAVFATTPGYLRTIFGYFAAGTSDPSITNRLDNYPRVEAAWRSAPWLGRGGGTDIAPDATKILDNQYLKSVVELGSFGVLALCLYFIVPVLAAVVARRALSDESMRSLSAAIAGACTAAVVGSFTFDSFSFAQFAGVHAVVVGLSGACWLHARRLEPPINPSLLPKVSS